METPGSYAGTDADGPAMFDTDLTAEHAAAARLGITDQTAYHAALAGVLCAEPTRARLQALADPQPDPWSGTTRP